MGTRADFYVGKGRDAEWIGSIAWDGYREGIPDSILYAKDEATFRTAVKEFFDSRDDVTLPEMGWPWPWDDSSITDCSYWLFGGRVWDETRKKYTPCSDGLDYDDEVELDAYLEDKDSVDFPNMSDKKNVTFGPRSGVLLIG